MARACQAEQPVTVAIAGVAGSGKTTLGRSLAAALRMPLLDLDAVTNPLLDGLQGVLLPEHWAAPPHRGVVRDARYAALRSVARDVVGTAGGAVIVAPFSAEVLGGAAWAALVAAVAPTELQLLLLRGDVELLAGRRTARGEPRDAHRPDPGEPPPPTVPHFGIDAELTPDQQLFRALRALGHRSPLSSDAVALVGSFDAVLFDLDGVLADSTASVARSWNRFAREFGVSAQGLQENHGKPARTLVELLLGPDRIRTGLARIEELEVADAESVPPVPGAREFFASVPEHRRAVVTSGTVPIATARLRAAGFPLPRTLVTIDDVSRGKPDPEPYLRAAERLGVPPARCLVVEDAPAGVTAARSAGCQVLAVLGTAAPDALTAAAVVVDGLDRVTITATSDSLRLILTKADPSGP